MHYLLPYIASTCSQDTLQAYALRQEWNITSSVKAILPKAYLEIGSKVLGDEGAVALAENCDFLLNVFYFILCFFQVNNLNGHYFLSPFVDAFKHFTKGALPYPLQFSKKLLRISTEILREREQCAF